MAFARPIRARLNSSNDYRWRSSMTSMLQDLGWRNLASRRNNTRLALFYKIVHQLVAVPTDDILIKADSRLRSNHKYKFKTIRTSSASYKHSFYPRTIIEWNALPQNIAEAPSLASFNVRLPTRTLARPALCWLSAATRQRAPPPQRHTPFGGLMSTIQIQIQILRQCSWYLALMTRTVRNFLRHGLSLQLSSQSMMS